MAPDLQAALVEHRPALVRHCYRMLGSYADAEDLVQDVLHRAWEARASYRGEAPLRRWLLTIATNTCLNALARRQRLSLPQLEADPAAGDAAFDHLEPERFITPAPDARLFPNPEDLSESRQTVALAFVALLQRVPPRQRAALLLKDVVGWSSEEIAQALELSVASVSSALHRGRAAVARDDVTTEEEPSPQTLRSFVRAWEEHDLEALVALLRRDLTLAMPPYATWLRGIDDVVRFFRSPRFSGFWGSGVRLVQTRANGLPAFGFYRRLEDGGVRPHSVMVGRFAGERAAELTVFLGVGHFPLFDLPLEADRTVFEAPSVMEGGGEHT